jgi:YihY family inner membrane protein
MKRMLRSFDGLQQRHRRLAIAVATLRKFSDDHSGGLAAMIAFWAFFSIFPLLLVLVTVLGWVLPAGDRASVLTHVAALFPLLDASSVRHLSGSTWALVLGVVTALWSGLGVVRTVQFAFDSVWEVPEHERIGTRAQLVRSVWVLATIGLGLVVSTFISGLVATGSSGIDLGTAGRIGGYLVAVALDVGLVIVAFRILTTRSVSLREVLPGGVLAGVAVFVLQQASATIISSHLRSAQATYGHFATVITILWWFYLQAEITLLAAQLNVVLHERLYPRSIVDPPNTDADYRALESYAAERVERPDERVEVRIERKL